MRTFDRRAWGMSDVCAAVLHANRSTITLKRNPNWILGRIIFFIGASRVFLEANEQATSEQNRTKSTNHLFAHLTITHCASLARDLENKYSQMRNEFARNDAFATANVTHTYVAPSRPNAPVSGRRQPVPFNKVMEGSLFHHISLNRPNEKRRHLWHLWERNANAMNYPILWKPLVR